MIQQADHNLEASSEFRRVSESGRWAVRKPDMYPGCPSAIAIAKKRKAKRQGDRWTTAGVELAKCASGSELLTAHAGGAFAMPLRQRVKGLQLPSEDLQRRMSRATWKLRGPRLVICGWIAYAHVVLRLEGLAISHGELATLLELRDPSWVGELLHDLRAWGLIAADPVWVQHGKASSQRANVYRLTNVGAHVFGLETLLAVGTLPHPEPDVAPRTRGRTTGTGVRTGHGGIARAHAGAHGPGISPDHPESTPDLITASREASSSQGGGRCRDHMPDRGPSVPAAPAAGCPAPVADGSLCLPHQDPRARPATLPAGSVEPGSAKTCAGKLSELVTCVLPHDQHAGSRSRRIRREGSLRQQARRQDDADRRRQDELREQLERRQAARAELEGPAPADPWAAVAAAAAADDRRAELERYRASLVHPVRMNKPRRDPDGDRLEVLEVLEASNKLRGGALPPDLAFELAELRRRRGGAS